MTLPMNRYTAISAVLLTLTAATAHAQSASAPSRFYADIGTVADFDPNAYGFQAFSEFLNFAQDKTVVRVEPNEDRGLIVYLGPEFYPPAEPPKPEPKARQEEEEEDDGPQPYVEGQPTIMEPNPPPPKPKKAAPRKRAAAPRTTRPRKRKSD